MHVTGRFSALPPLEVSVSQSAPGCRVALPLTDLPIRCVCPPSDVLSASKLLSAMPSLLTAYSLKVFHHPHISVSERQFDRFFLDLAHLMLASLTSEISFLAAVVSPEGTRVTPGACRRYIRRGRANRNPYARRLGHWPRVAGHRMIM